MSKVEIASLVIETGTEEKSLVLQNSTVIRPLSIGSDWTQIRIGILAAMNDPASDGDFQTDADFYIGLCSNTTTSLGAGNVGHFCGLHMQADQNPSWNLVGANVQMEGSKRAEVIVAGSVTQNGSNDGTEWFINEIGDSELLPLYVDITKGSPNWTVAWYGRDDGSAPTSITNATFDEDMLASDLTSQGGDSRYSPAMGSQTVTAPDEGTNGSLTHVTLHFAKPTNYELYVSRVAVSQFA